MILKQGTWLKYNKQVDINNKIFQNVAAIEPKPLLTTQFYASANR